MIELKTRITKGMPEEERTQWAELYRFYDRYAQRIRDSKTSDAVTEVFLEAVKEAQEIYTHGDISRALILDIYALLESIAVQNCPTQES